MGSIFADFHEAQHDGKGRLLASCLAPVNTAQDPLRLQSFAQLSNAHTIEADVRHNLLQLRPRVKLSKVEGNAWVEVFVWLWKCMRELALLQDRKGGEWKKAYEAYEKMCNALIRGYQVAEFQAWTVPCLSTAGKYLKLIAAKADSEGEAKDSNGDAFGSGFSDDIMSGSSKNDTLSKAANIINKMFAVCLNDRSELTDSRKWGIYSTSNLLFKTYFKLNSISLTRNVIRALDAAKDDLPPLDLFPRSHRCTFEYYRGRIDFLQENYSSAEQHLNQALSLCHREALKNREQILTYLIPTHVLNHHQLPSTALLAPHPALAALLNPLFKAVKMGSLYAFDQALAAAEPGLVQRRIYLTLERTRDLCMRNLFRKVFLAAGYDETKNPEGEVPGKIRRTRIKIDEFEAGMKLGYRPVETSDRTPADLDQYPTVVDRDEVECFIANLIYKNLMKGYIARERGIVVLSKAGAFPGTKI